MMTNHSHLSLGIDTGGTFTDGVLLDPLTRQVLQTTKALTTHHDLKLCIEEVLEQLTPIDPSQIGFVSLSTTLATNAIAEGKRRPVGLFLLGYDPELVRQFRFERQFGTPDFTYITGRHGLDGLEQEPLDEISLRQAVREVHGRVDALAIASYAGPRNAAHEQRAAEICLEETGLPVVQAHHLSTELDSIRRATTASLNASLLNNLDEFLEAVQKMLLQRGIHAPLLMVRGDGSVVQASFARTRPVEIIHSGPATSTIGGQFLAGVDTALVIDIGGTTTDIALVSGGKSQVLEKSATVGPYRTCVRTIQTRSFGLGGDSRIQFDRHGELQIGPERVLPLSHLCAIYPEMKAELQELLVQRGSIHYSDELEFWRLRREPRRPLREPRAVAAVELLRQGPRRLRPLLKQVKAVSPVLLDVDDLVNQEIIERCGLTPTDLLHVTGEFTPWDEVTARLVVEAVARNWEESAAEFIARVRKQITQRITAETIEFLSGRPLSEPSYQVHRNPLDRWLYEESLAPQNPYLGSRIFLKVPIVGIGAPANAFLPDVATALATELILPEHYAVANAVGTVVGSVLVRMEADVFPCLEGPSITGYFARVGSEQPKFNLHETALEHARSVLHRLVTEEAKAAGADEAVVEIEEGPNVHGMVHLSAWAVGKPGQNHSIPARSLQDRITSADS